MILFNFLMYAQAEIFSDVCTSIALHGWLGDRALHGWLGDRLSSFGPWANVQVAPFRSLRGMALLA